MSKPKWLLNPKTGAVMACTPILLKNGTGLVACEKDGTPLGSYDIDEDGDVVESNYLLNPKTGALLPYSLLLARKEGLIPCQSQQHANKILANLDREDLMIDEVEDEPDTDTVVGLDDSVSDAEESDTEEETVPQDGAEEERGTAIEEMASIEIPKNIQKMKTKKELVEYAYEKYGEKLDGRVNMTMLREEVAMLELQREQQSEEDIEKVSMV